MTLIKISTPVFILMVAVTNFGCASARRACPDTSEEAVSVCRAEKACGKGSATNIISLFLGGMGGGMSGSNRNSAAEAYESCVSRNLSAQKANNGIADNTIRCKTTRVNPSTLETECE